MTGIEGGSELPQRKLLACSIRPFEEDDRAATMGDLWQLQFAKMFT